MPEGTVSRYLKKLREQKGSGEGEGCRPSTGVGGTGPATQRDGGVCTGASQTWDVPGRLQGEENGKLTSRDPKDDSVDEKE